MNGVQAPYWLEGKLLACAVENLVVDSANIRGAFERRDTAVRLACARGGEASVTPRPRDRAAGLEDRQRRGDEGSRGLGEELFDRCVAFHDGAKKSARL